MDFPCTQQLPDLDETFMSDDDQEKKQVGKLVVKNQSEGNVQEFPILEGENIIGRHSDCDINIEHGVALSKKHACIEVIGGQVVVFDCGSRNKTRIGKMKLKPDVRYAVRDREIIKFANIECTYLQNPETPEKKMKSDSVSSIASLIDATIATPSMKSTLLAVDTPETSTLINKKNQIDIDCIPDSQPVHDSFISESSFSTEVEKVTFDSDEQNINYEVNNNKQSPIHCAIDSEIEESILSSPDSPQISLKLDE
uniref:FHA domain-containing protein n=1 Tax=Ciona savignyi TaxID=51511 RepID=H2Z508_CIOSA